MIQNSVTALSAVTVIIKTAGSRRHISGRCCMSHDKRNLPSGHAWITTALIKCVSAQSDQNIHCLLLK